MTDIDLYLFAALLAGSAPLLYGIANLSKNRSAAIPNILIGVATIVLALYIYSIHGPALQQAAQYYVVFALVVVFFFVFTIWFVWHMASKKSPSVVPAATVVATSLPEKIFFIIVALVFTALTCAGLIRL